MSKLNATLLEMVSKRTNIFDTLLFLYSYTCERASWRPGFRIAELGVNGGNSTVAFSVALSEANNGGRLYSCDVVECIGAADLVAQAGSEKVWTLEKCDSLSFAKRFDPESLDVVFIDTTHEYNQTTEELATYKPLLRPGGRFFLHDTYSRPHGVGRAFKEFCAANPTWESWNLDVDCGLGSIRKP